MHVLLDRDVAPDRDSRSELSGDLRGGSLSALMVERHDADGGTFLRQAFGHGSAKSAPAAGDDGNLASQSRFSQLLVTLTGHS